MQSFIFANESSVMIFMKLHKNSRVSPQPQKFSAENFELFIDCYIPGLPILTSAPSTNTNTIQIQ